MTERGPFDFDVSRMTVEEVKDRLRAAGLPVDEWVSNEDRVKEGDTARIPTFQRYAEHLLNLRGLLEQQAEADVKQMDELNYQLRRLEHGGGR